MDLESIRLLMRVVECGSIQRAAQLSGTSRTSLRRRLENLEAAVGNALFVRSAAGVALTPAGAVVLEEGRALLERYARMVSSARAAKGDPGGRILVVIPPGVPDLGRIALLHALQDVAPGICLQDVERAEPLDHLHEPFDLMFHFGDPPSQGRWFSRVLARVRLVPLASEAYFAKHGRPTSVADLGAHRLLSWQFGRCNPREWPLLSGGAIPIEPVYCSRNGQTLHRAAQDGVGILLGDPNPMLVSGLAPPLVPVLEDEIGGELTFRCLSPLASDVDLRSRTIVERLQSLIGQLAPEA